MLIVLQIFFLLQSGFEHWGTSHFQLENIQSSNYFDIDIDNDNNDNDNDTDTGTDTAVLVDTCIVSAMDH